MPCHFEKGFSRRNIPYNQLTKNDLQGRKLLILGFLTCISLVTYITSYTNKNKTITTTLFLVFLVYLYITYLYYKEKPIRMLYLGGYLISLFIISSPYPDIEQNFPNHHLFESNHNFSKIKKEIKEVLQDNKSLPLTKNTFNNLNKNIGNGLDGEQKDNEDGWKILIISTGGQFTPKGLQKCPFLCKLVQSCPEIQSCVVSILPPHKGIPIHIGYYKGIIRYQLGVIIPKDSKKVYLCVNGQRYYYKEGEGVIFDDTFAHKVYNNSNSYRVVIYMDIQRKKLPYNLDYLNHFFIRSLLESKEVKNEIKRTEYQVDIEEGFISGFDFHY
jgi:beta-hydroxylase